MVGARSEHPHFDILEPCGAGAMGVVYQARDKRLNRIVALKFLSSGGHAEPGAVARSRREAEAIAALNHPAIATTVASALSSAPELRDRYLVVPSSEVWRSQIHTVAEARRQFNASQTI